jgi:hypothetical protein
MELSPISRTHTWSAWLHLKWSFRALFFRAARLLTARFLLTIRHVEWDACPGLRWDFSTPLHCHLETRVRGVPQARSRSNGLSEMSDVALPSELPIFCFPGYRAHCFARCSSWFPFPAACDEWILQHVRPPTLSRIRSARFLVICLTLTTDPPR